MPCSRLTASGDRKGPHDRARRREEWGRRFTTGLEAVTSSDPRRRATGRALLVQLIRSGLATAEDRRQAAAVLDAVATHNPGGDLRLVLSEGHLDAVSGDQVESARALVEISGGPDKVDPLIAKVASAQPKGSKNASRNVS